MKQTYITLLFPNGKYESFDISDYVKHHYLRNDDPIDWNYFIEEESGYLMDEIVGYLISGESFETILTTLNQ